MPPKKRRTKRASSRSRTKATPLDVADIPQVGEGERIWVLDTPWEERPKGTTYITSWKARVYVGANLPEALSEYACGPFTYLRLVEDRMNAHHGLPARTVETPLTMRPYQLQIDGARAIVRHAATGAPQYLLADDTGVGKTLTAVLAAKAVLNVRGGKRVLVIADRPGAITIPAWAATIAAVGHDTITWCVVTWDNIKKVRPWRWDIIVADEAQALRHQSTARFGHWQHLSGARRKPDERPYLLMATATPGHTPTELGYLAPTFAHATGTNLRGWTGNDGATFIDALSQHGVHIVTGGRYGPEWTSDPRERRADLDLVRSWQEGAMIHRDAPWGPPKVIGVGVALSPTQRVQYAKEWGQFCRDMALAKRGKDVAKGRAAVIRLRQKASLLRADVTAEWVLSKIDAGYQVVVSVQHVETGAEPISRALEAAGVAVARLYGTPSQTGRDPETERRKFQTGQCPVVVTTKTAAINLEANQDLGGRQRATSTPRIGVFHQARYSGIEGRQVVGRTHRDHQRCNWYVHYAQNTIEEAVSKVMVTRYATTADMVGGDTSALADIAAALGAEWMPADALADADE